MARMEPLPPDVTGDVELEAAFSHFMSTLGMVPNSLLTMQRVPAIAKATIQFNRAVFAPDSKVDLGFKRMIGHMSSAAAGCQYCKAHTAVSATRAGIDEEKMAAIWEYQTCSDVVDATFDRAVGGHVVDDAGDTDGDAVAGLLDPFDVAPQGALDHLPDTGGGLHQRFDAAFEHR